MLDDLLALIIAIVVLWATCLAHLSRQLIEKIGLESNELPSLNKEFTYLLTLLTIKWTQAGDCPCVHPLSNINISNTNGPIDKAALG